MVDGLLHGWWLDSRIHSLIGVECNVANMYEEYNKCVGRPIDQLPNDFFFDLHLNDLIACRFLSVQTTRVVVVGLLAEQCTLFTGGSSCARRATSLSLPTALVEKLNQSLASVCPFVCPSVCFRFIS